jgi:uncharacterized membrane protein YfhO
MKNIKNFFLKFWPILIILAVWFIFSSPYFLQQKVPFASDYQVNFFSPWNAYPGFSSPVKNNAMPDVISQIFPWKTFTIDTLKNFQIPLWNPYSFSGTPHLANYQSAVLSPFNLTFFVLPFIDAWSLMVLRQPLLAGLFMYLCLRSLKVSKEGSVIGSISFMFCGFIVTWMAYETLAYAIIFLPLAIYAVEKYYQTGKSRFLALFSLTLPLSLFSGHFQISIYFFIFIVSYLLYKLITSKDIKTSLKLFLYLFFGILLSLPQLLPSIELYTQTLRSGIFQKIEVIPWGYLPTFIAPDFFGNPVTRNDWFGHYAEWNGYIGVLPLMLSFYAIFLKRTKVVLYFFLVSLITLLLSFQTPILDILVSLKIPVISTSAASRIIVIFSFCMSVLAAFGFQALMKDIKDKKIRQVLYWFFSFILIFIFIWALVMFRLFIPVDKILISKQNFILPTLIFILSSLIILLSLFAFKIKPIKKYIFLLPLLLILIVSFDLLRFANKWMPFDPRDRMYPKIAVESKLNEISGYNRVLSNLGGEATTYYKLPSVEGYDAVYIQRYGEFVKYLDNGEFGQSFRSVVSFPKRGLYTKEAVNFLGMKYLVHKTADGRSPWVFPFWEYEDGVFNRIYNDNYYEVFENKDAFPRAYLVNKYKVELDSKKILELMFNDTSLREEVILEEDPKLKLDDVSGSAKISSYAPNKVTIETDSKGNSLLFLSDTYYKGWNAYVDGKKTKIYRADYTFRAVFVPKGTHEVIFKYEPLSFKLGLLGAFLGLLFIVGMGIKNKFI